MKTNIDKIHKGIEAIETNILAGSSLTDTQRNFQICIQVLCDEIRDVLGDMEMDHVRVEDMDHDQRFPDNLLVMDNPEVRFDGQGTPDLSLHRVQDVVLSDPNVTEHEIYGTTVFRSLFILQEVAKDGKTEIRKFKIALFSDDKDKVKMGRGNIAHSINEQVRLQMKKDEEG